MRPLWLLLGLLIAAAGCQRVGIPTPASPDLPRPSTDRRGSVEVGAERPGPPERVSPEVRREPEPGARGSSRTPLPEDVRALWVVRTALAHPDSARAAVRRAHDAGFNTLLVQVRGRGDALYRSRWEPRAEILAGAPAGYDPLGTVLEEARPLGIAVHAWLNAQVVASAVRPPQDPGHLIHTRPDLLAIPRDLTEELFRVDPHDPRYLDSLLGWSRANGATVEGLFASPVHPDAEEHLVRVVLDLLDRYAVDGIHLDYLRYPSPEFDYSRSTLEAFRDWVRVRTGSGAEGAESRWRTEPLAYVGAFPVLWDAFRESAVTGSVRRVASEVRGRRPGTLLSVAVFPDPEDALRARYQNWAMWVREGVVDVVVPMAYTPEDALFERQILWARDHAGPQRVWAGVGVYQTSFDGAVRKSRAAHRLGLGGVALFSYDWAVGAEGTAAAGGAFLTRYGASVWGQR